MRGIYRFVGAALSVVISVLFAVRVDPSGAAALVCLTARKNECLNVLNVHEPKIVERQFYIILFVFYFQP